LNETAREQLGRQLANDLAARVSPPPPAGLSPADYLHTVLAERHNRELARLMPPAGYSPAASSPGGTPWPAPPSAPPARAVPPQDTTFTPPA
jgi:hypothetical protein